MPKKNGKREPTPAASHLLPGDLLHFVETTIFSRKWLDLGLDDEDDLYSLQAEIMRRPRKSPVLKGTGGLRKMRFAAPKWNIGKRGALRVCYVYFESFHIVLLVTTYSKGEADDLDENVKSAIRKLIQETEDYLRSNASKLGFHS